MDNRTKLIVAALLVVLAILALPLMLGNEEEENMETVEDSTPAVPVVETQPPAPEPRPQPVTPQTAVTEPLEPQPEPVELPDLNESDSFVVDQIGSLENGNPILQMMASGQSIRKFVVLIDNMSRGDVPARDLPVLGPRTELTATEQGENLYEMQPSSYARFDEAVNAFTSVSTEEAVAMIMLMEPLFEESYAELGYRNRQFRDALDEAIDNVLNARLPDGEILLTRPSVHYEFADPQLENMSSVEKLLIRMGPENAEKVQGKVEEIKAALPALPATE